MDLKVPNPAATKGFDPKNASEEEIRKVVEAAIAGISERGGRPTGKDMGVVMKAVQAKLKGKTVDGKALREKVRALLG